MKVCPNCRREVPRYGGYGLCHACYRWRKKHGTDRPNDLPTSRTYPRGSKPGVTTRQAADLSGLSFRQLDYWHRTGRVRPSAEEFPSEGSHSGFTRWWSDEDVARLTRIRERLDFGLTLEAACRTEDPGNCPPAWNDSR